MCLSRCGFSAVTGTLFAGPMDGLIVASLHKEYDVTVAPFDGQIPMVERYELVPATLATNPVLKWRGRLEAA